MKLVPVVPVPATADLPDVCETVWGDGAAVLPLDPAVGGSEAAAIAERVEVVPEEVAAVLFTSGTSGRPKAVMLSHDALATAAALSNMALGAGPGSRWLACVPLHHVAGFGILMRARRMGVPALIHERFDVEAVRRAEADLVSLVPTMLWRLLEAEVDLTRFTVLLGGARIPSDLLRRAGAAGIRLVRSYGMTETCGGVVYDGVPLPGVEVELDAEGRISISSPTVMVGYHGDRPGLGLDGGRFVTADRGRWIDGRLEVLGRLDRVIVTGGENVSADEVEALLLEIPEVRDAAVFGAPDDEWGETVIALVVAPGSSVEEITAAMRARAKPHQVPKRVVCVTEIPRTAAGNTDVQKARKLLES